MVVSDPVADLLTRVRNGLRARHQVVQIPQSKLKLEVVRVLKEEGFVRNFKVVEAQPRGVIKVLLKYGPSGESVIHGLRRVSRPGCRIYAGKDAIPKVFGGLGISVLSTSQGVMTGHRARHEGIGGEVLCSVW